MSIYALAARHADQIDDQISQLERGERCLQRAKVLLINELSEPKPKIPTIQGLLILGGRQCAVGNSSEGWLYTGMVSCLHSYPHYWYRILADVLPCLGNTYDQRHWSAPEFKLLASIRRPTTCRIGSSEEVVFQCLHLGQKYKSLPGQTPNPG